MNTQDHAYHQGGEGLLTARGLACGFGGRMLFDALNITLNRGEVLIVRGANGAGKTSLLKILAGLRPPQTGVVEIMGIPLLADRVRAAGRLIFIGHGDGLAPEITPGEAIRLWAHTRGLKPRPHHLTAAFDTLQLTASMHHPIRILSAGQKRRCAMVRLALINAMAVHEAAPLWLLDEPTTAMDDGGHRIFAGLIDHHTSHGGAVVMASHGTLPLASPARSLSLTDMAASPRGVNR